MAEITSIYGNKFVDEKARQDIAESKEQIQQNTNDVSNLKEDFHEYHSELGAGYADQIVSSIENEDQTPYNFRKVPYDATLEMVEGIVGCDVVVNQLITFSAGSYTTQGITVTKGNDGSMTFNGTATGNIYSDFYSNFQNVLTANHKYLFLFENPTGYATLVNSFGSPSITTKSGRIVPYAESQKVFLSVFIENGKTCNNEKVYPMCTDLTAMFGTAIADYVYSLETATAGAGVEWLKKHFPKIFDAGYIAYNAGTMVHVSGLSAKKTVGFNQWDEVWEVGGMYSGTVNAKNLIPVLPSTEYFMRTLSPVNFTFYVRFFDADKNPCAGYETVTGVVQPKDTAITTPSNARYMQFRCGAQYGTTYKNDICINLSDPARNGTYEPYEAHEYPLDSTIDLHGILKLDAQNNLYADGDVYKPDGSVTRNAQHLSGNRFVLHNTSSAGYKTYKCQTTAEERAKIYQDNVIFNNFDAPTVASINSATVATECIQAPSNGDSGILYVAISPNRDINDCEFVYLLATPTTEQAEPYTQTQICDPNGTEEYISETVAPVGHVTRYPENLRKKIEGLPWNFATLIAPTEAAFVATRNYTTGSLFIVNNVLYKATANIANGGAITPNSNCTATTLADVISAIQ